MKTYTIGDREFTQDELVLSQEEALGELIGPLMGGQGDLTPESLVKALLLEKGLRKALAVVLVPKGETVANRDLPGLEQYLADNLTLSLQAEVVRDFFEITTKAADAWKDLGTMVQKVKAGKKA
jgi:hypothetical protein